MKRLLQSLFLMLFIAVQAWAQERTVTGTVTDKSDGVPLPGVSIKVTGTTAGTTTDGNGRFSVQAPAGSTNLTFSYIGYLSQTFPITGGSMNVALTADSRQLGEVVVVGYGTQRRQDVTGSISKVSGGDIVDRSTPSFDRQLAGKASGVQVITPSGLLGQAPQIRIRGTNSISNGTSPLIVIDGVPALSGNVGGATSVNALGDINPNDIESFDILKDGAATAVYGSRASNGVILITTKRGKTGTTSFNYDTYYATANVSKRLDLLNADQFITVVNERYAAAGVAPQAFPMADPAGGFVNTDWQDYAFRQANQQNHSLSASGGTEQTKYFFSLGYSDQTGVIQANSLKRYSLRANLDQKINKFLNFGVTAGLTFQNNRGPLTGGNAISGNIYGILRMLPNVPVYNPADPTGYNLSSDRRSLGPGSNLSPISDNTPNSRFVLDNNTRKTDSFRLLGSTFLEANIADGLKFRTQLGADGSYTDDFSLNDPRHGDGFGSTGSISQTYAPFFRYNWQNILTYAKTFNTSHNLDVTLVSEIQKERSSSYTAQVQNLSDIFFTQNITSGTFVTPNSAGGLTTNGIESYLARLNYNFKNKYYIGASIRADKLSALPTETRLGYFPGASVAYRISEEGFFKNTSGLNFISDFRIRASVAEVGNTDIGNFPYLGTYGAAAYGGQSGIAFNNTGNPELKWESQRIYDAGFNMGILENRFNFTVAYWRKDNDDIILFAPTPPSLGVPGNGINRNIGSVKNSGWEFDISADVLRKSDFSWTSSLNFSTQKNTVLGLVDGQDIIPTFNNSTFNIIRVGESMRALYGYQYEGVNAANGNPLYRKANGTVIQGNVNNGSTYHVYDPANPGVLGAASSLSATDRKILGDVLPTWFGGFNNSVSYKNFDMNVFFRFQGGNVIYNRTRVDLLNMNMVNNGTEMLGRWQSAANPGDGMTPKQYFGRSAFINLDQQAYSRFVEKGDFLRLDNLSLGYRIPASALSKIGVSKLRLYASAQNVFVVTDYSGLDPEVNSNGAGVDYNGNPQQRTFTFGLNLGL